MLDALRGEGVTPVIAHPEREPLIKQGAYPGLLGRNKELHY